MAGEPADITDRTGQGRAATAGAAPRRPAA